MPRPDARFWRWILQAYPAEFRYEFGPELLQALQERSAEERGYSRLRFYITAAADVISTACKAHYYKMIRDLRYSMRRLLAHKGVAAVAVLSLALGIGANSAMFSIVYAAMLRPLPYADGERQMTVAAKPLNSTGRNAGFIFVGSTSADFLDWRAQSKTLEYWHMFTHPHPSTALGTETAERITLQSATPGLLASLGVRPVIGRLFRPGEEAQEPALISEPYWRRRFGGSMDVLGQKLTVDGGVYTIVGVVPGNFELFNREGITDAWNTVDLTPGSNWIQRSMPWILATAKLKKGVSLQQARAEMDTIAAGLAQAYPATNKNRGAAVTPMVEVRNGGLGSTLYPLFGAVGFVLLIACTNVANLLLARATARRREISVRAALGAGRHQLIREFLSDGLVLAGPGVMAGIALAYGGVVLFRAVAPPGLVGVDAVEINLPVLAFTAAAGALAGLLAAFFPAMEASRADVTEGLNEGARGSAGRTRQRLRSILVAGEIALALVLLVGASLAIQSLLRFQNYRLGFDPENVTVAQLHLSGKRYMQDAPQREIDMRYVEPAVKHFLEHALREVQALPGVLSAALAGTVPMGPANAPGVGVRVIGKTESQAEMRRAEFNAVTSGFFETLRIPLRSGRYINDRDVETSGWVAVVNESFVREFFPEGDVLGRFILLTPAPDERPREIVGVVSDHTQFDPRLPVRPEVYTSAFQQVREIPGNFQGQRLRPKLIVRTQPGAAPRPEVLQKIVAGFDKNIAIFDVRTLEWHIAQRSSWFRFFASALFLFSGIAIALAAVGIYGLMSYSVTDRFHEIGIRVSLGASRTDIVRLILSSGFKLTMAGAVVGIGGALIVSRLIETRLFGVKPWDPFSFLVVTAMILGVAMAACGVPAMRATVVDPLVALRRE